MIFPTLEPTTRKREFESYSDELHSLTVQAWLFDGKTHREIERDILGLDPTKSKGFQAMGILHFIGLKANSRNIFSGMDLATARAYLDNNSFSSLIPFIYSNNDLDSNQSLQNLIIHEQSEVKKSIEDTEAQRKARLKKAKTKPKRTRVYSFIYTRNPDVIAEALERANGVCEKCKKDAPFKRSTNGSPYLEVHHLTALSNGGLDTVENVQALCPNCHRELHFGEFQ